jgi:Na+-translocating ferredoxin:NAD+ oxidoreductase subunit B
MPPVAAHIATAALFMASLGVMLAAVLAYANRRLYVYEDPRVSAVDEYLPHANCGACGKPGCSIFAEAVVAGEMDPGRCTVNSAEMNQAIADLLGVEVVQHEKYVARLACAGGSHVSYTRARYAGLQTCRAAAVAGGGGKGCAWGCIGLGDCEVECEFNAITMNKFSLPEVDTARCTACGDCVEVCPKDLFSLQPLSHKLWIACKNQDQEDEGEAHCDLVCTACGRCVADSPEGVITLRDNLAVIDYAKNSLASRVAIERCPTGAIVWLDDKHIEKGVEAKRIVRKEAIPITRMEPLPRI